jgi:hypothetical protein
VERFGDGWGWFVVLSMQFTVRSRSLQVFGTFVSCLEFQENFFKVLFFAAFLAGILNSSYFVLAVAEIYASWMLIKGIDEVKYEILFFSISTEFSFFLRNPTKRFIHRELWRFVVTLWES